LRALAEKEKILKSLLRRKDGKTKI